jgi:intein-encoded DNA endonuclease-like protein
MKTQIINLYQSGLGMSKIAYKLNISSTTVWNILKTNNIEIRRKHSKIDEDYFENPNTEKSTYWAGFIAADGYIYNPNKGNSQSSLTIELAIKDKKHLSKLGADLCKNITDYDKHNSCKLRVTSNKICKDLEQYKIYQNKSLTLKFPENINNKNIHHFIRGYFDGDGSFYKIYDIVGNQQFLKSLIDSLPFEC